MRVFISSVRHGLEAERDALPGLIAAIGHEPLVFEQFTAQTTPSREACLRAVASADVYVLLLGPNYGHRFPDTNQSPTHDEWLAARAAGLPTLVFKKGGVDVEPDQAAFIQEVGDYGTGAFYDTFTNVPDLQTKVAAALRSHATTPTSLVFDTLDHDFDVEWRDDWRDARGVRHDQHAAVELHVVPLDGRPLTNRSLTGASSTLAERLRASGTVPVTSGVEVHADERSVAVHVTAPARHGEVESARFLGARLSSRGQLSAWTALPTDRLGAILDERDLRETLTTSLRTLGTIGFSSGTRFGLATGLGGALTMVSRGSVTGVARNSASMRMNSRPVRYVMDESVSEAAFGTGASEVAAHLAHQVLQQFDAP